MNDNEYQTDEEFLEHFGVKGMKWGRRKSDSSESPRKSFSERRRENMVERVKTGAELRKINSKGFSTDRSEILKARKALPKAQQKYFEAKDSYKLNKGQMNRIAAKRPMTLAVADFKRISKQASVLTPKEKNIYDNIQIGRQFSAIFYGKPDPITQAINSSDDRADAIRRANEK